MIALMAVGLLAPSVYAGGKGWDNVKKLKLDERLLVKMDDMTQFKCYFRIATDDELVCLPLLRVRNLPSTPPEYDLERDRIREVSKRHTSAQGGVLEDALVGGGLGAIVGVAHPPSNPPQGRDVAILAGSRAVAFIVVDHVFPLFHHGVIFKRRDDLAWYRPRPQEISSNTSGKN
ncbi:MAG TPA: hypothetical protein VJN21_13005 [Candidatus Acidoferrales bacterium]|nr:hypothetical protein [Candidatus Acidoferrales bacterium]